MKSSLHRGKKKRLYELVKGPQIAECTVAPVAMEESDLRLTLHQTSRTPTCLPNHGRAREAEQDQDRIRGFANIAKPGIASQSRRAFDFTLMVAVADHTHQQFGSTGSGALKLQEHPGQPHTAASIFIPPSRPWIREEIEQYGIKIYQFLTATPTKMRIASRTSS
ncbi:septin 4b isoform X2 [Lates japonicus]|uniref:Septin 4b isoform X2 n=1 Tax=Lates japonicus TaxID=270547 RepID=A0AAD3NH69_LATJO|nr:septin 4b isoform X2 [Lates japonicus]